MRNNIIAAAVALAIALPPPPCRKDKTAVRPVSGLYSAFVAKAFTDANPNYEVTMLPGNSTSNVIQLQQKKADLSIGMHTMNMAAIKGRPQGVPQHRLRQLNDTARSHFVVIKKSGITSIAQRLRLKMPVRPLPTARSAVPAKCFAAGS